MAQVASSTRQEAELLIQGSLLRRYDVHYCILILTLRFRILDGAFGL